MTRKLRVERFMFISFDRINRINGMGILGFTIYERGRPYALRNVSYREIGGARVKPRHVNVEF